jgi:hypothetical protein
MAGVVWPDDAIFVPAEETCFVLLEANSIDHVHRTTRLADVSCDRPPHASRCRLRPVGSGISSPAVTLAMGKLSFLARQEPWR